MNMNKNVLLVSLIVLVLFTGFYLSKNKPAVEPTEYQTEFGGTPGNIPAQLFRATTTVLADKQVVRVFDDWTVNGFISRCASRAVSVAGGFVNVSFDEPRNNLLKENLASTTLSSTRGHQVVASTTEVFDSALFGCGDMFIYSSGSTTVTISEFR
jgi:hypothetical protein